MTDILPLSRRGLLSHAGLAVTGLAAAATIGLPAAATAAGPASKPPVPRAQVPGVYRIPVGDSVITAIADGYGTLPLAAVTGATRPEADALGRAAFVPPGDLPIDFNAYLIETPKRRILVDTGGGTALGAGAGKLNRNLAAAGIDPKSIDVLLITHLHLDHIGGMLTAAGAPAFPNAELLVHAKERAYWTDDAMRTRAPADFRGAFDAARAALNAYARRTTLLERDGQEVVSGVTIMELPGHTPGHVGVRVASGARQHLIWGDIIHVPHLQFAQPAWGVVFDVDGALAVKTRKAMLDMAAADGLDVSGMHLVFPGPGHVVRSGNAYAFAPARWQYDI
ncbi:MBL fold metallo-hydrolase [Azorhizobium oxalatiphilum]|uniref:MBL fold metallo-hydrolase n=1 Tax=Azorhizobium oxalatiphilum TaxID=980631 RepID=A0A917BNC0_9HYPH|nr:MBL fold metallo-hydrolase [Azorhizobium oxalatiphilum]GGF52850.1 MBL fold metallo-hydrolase [Azorhizobium oxalatiphilum]